MTKQIHNTGKIVTMDSGFCVSVVILALHDVGVFGQYLIKKNWQFWPKHVKGGQIDIHMKDEAMGHVITLKPCIDRKIIVARSNW